MIRTPAPDRSRRGLVPRVQGISLLDIEGASRTDVMIGVVRFVLIRLASTSTVDQILPGQQTTPSSGSANPATGPVARPRTGLLPPSGGDIPAVCAINLESVPPQHARIAIGSRPLGPSGGSCMLVPCVLVIRENVCPAQRLAYRQAPVMIDLCIVKRMGETGGPVGTAGLLRLGLHIEASSGSRTAPKLDPAIDTPGAGHATRGIGEDASRGLLGMSRNAKLRASA